MSAREDLINEVTWSLKSGDFLYGGDAYADAVKMVDAFAHELAEKIRNHPDHDDAWGKGFYSTLGLGMAADMIDPEVEN